MNTIKDQILIRVNTRKVITARTLISELLSYNQAWSKDEIKKSIIELSRNNFIKEFELRFPDLSNESIFVPIGTRMMGEKL